MNYYNFQQKIIQQIGSYYYPLNKKIKSIEVVSENKAIITFNISDYFYFNNIFKNDENFEIKAIIDKNTIITKFDSKLFKNMELSISDLNDIERIPDSVLINLDKDTLNDENPIVTKIDFDMEIEPLNQFI